MKKTGTRKPKATASTLLSTASRSTSSASRMISRHTIAGGERAEQHVEIEHDAQRDERGEDEEDDADRELARGVQRRVDDAVQRALRHPERQPDRRPATTATNSTSTMVAMPGSRPPRKREIAISGPNSPTAPIAPIGLAEGRVQLARVAEDRQEGAEGRGAQGDADDDRVLAGRDEPAEPDTEPRG